ncbi:MAG TPA: iron-siderophore ABC transporter substrate-binding protein [Yinghuangia sp.]|uniref:iron-siderophore ABC transporter substrate-binding protein n=1 Tax=Yinghuangia sp. YIM S10712 TaxID=3436930 RepID=UPI002CF5F39E|nr:iron-siderophore ABC transporter substrate-binding protein [Yinghuangia sp.]
MTAALVLSLAACGDDEDKDATNTGASTAASAGASAESAAPPAAAYPVTITHKLGTTTIKEAPKRIVALGEGDQDAALALGVQLVGMVETTPITPWAQPKITGDKPELITMGENGAPIEKVLALKPDLILANTDYWVEQEYKKLSEIAPTTAFEVGPSQDSWQQVVLQVGKALGKSAEAQKLVADTDAKVANVQKQYPEIVGKTFALTLAQDAGSIMVLKDKEDISVKMLRNFGMTHPDNIAALPGEGFAAQLSLERLDLLEVNVLLSGYNGDAGVQKAVEGNPQFAKLNVVTRGSYVALDSNDFYALRNATVLSVEWIIDNLIPRISKAAKAAGA